MKKFMKHLALAAVALAAGGSAMASSDFQTGAGALTANGRVDIRLTIPKILFVQVGTGSYLTTDPTVNLLDFAPTAASLGTGTAVVSTGGDLGGGAGVTARVIGNNGNVSFTSTTTGALDNGSGDLISFNQFTVATAAHPTFPSATTLAHPGLVDGATSAAVVLTAVNKVVSQAARWDFTYNNANLYAAGTYGGVSVNNGRVVYTASLP